MVPLADHFCAPMERLSGLDVADRVDRRHRDGVHRGGPTNAIVLSSVSREHERVGPDDVDLWHRQRRCEQLFADN